jgi:hypothetical protein
VSTIGGGDVVDNSLTREEARVVLPGLERVVAELRKDRTFFAHAITDEADRKKIIDEYDANLALARSARTKLRRTAS